MFHLYIPNPCRESQILHELAFFCVVFSKPTSCPYSHSQHGVQPQPYCCSSLEAAWVHSTKDYLIDTVKVNSF